MIGGGKWNVQDKILNGTYINFVSNDSSSRSGRGSGNSNINSDETCTFLLDKNGFYLKTADGMYLAVSS